MALPRPMAPDGESEDYDNWALDWDGKPLSRAAIDFILLLAASRSPQVPAFVFLRPFTTRQSWSPEGELCSTPISRILPSVASLFVGGSNPEAKAIGPALPQEPFAWYCDSVPRVSEVSGGSYEDDAVRPGKELDHLLFSSALAADVKDDLVYFSLSDRLKRILSKTPTNKWRKAKMDFVKLAISCLSDPYIEPLWELVLLRCRDILKSTVIPYLSCADSDEFADLSRWIISDRPLGAYTLAFHLTHLGFIIDSISWAALTDRFPIEPEFFVLQRKLSMHLNGTSPVANSHEVRLYESSSVLLRSLIGFTIALIPRKATDPEFPRWYKTLSNSWLQEGDTLLSTMETVAHSLLFPDVAEAERLVDHFTESVQSSLGIAFSASGYPNKASILLRNSLGKIELYKSYGPRPAESVEYGLLSAELINCNNLVDRTEELCSWGLSLAKARDEAHLGRRFDSICVKLATADAHIALAAYPTAEHVLNQVLGLIDLDPFIKIVSRFRLNKIWRRTDQTAASFGKNLRQIVPLIEDALPEVQVEFLAELAATLAHLRGAEWADSDHSAMNDVVRETLDLYKKHDILQDDWRLERIKVASAKMSKAIPIAPQREGSDVSVRHAAESQIDDEYDEKPALVLEELLQDIVVGEDSTFRTKNASSEDWERRNVIERTRGSIHTRVELLEVTHGTLDEDGDEATLMVFRFRFDPQKSSRRVLRARVNIEFLGKDGGIAPIVEAIAPEERWTVVPTTDSETTTRGGELNLGASGVPFLEAGATAKLEKTISRDVSDATTVSGSINLGRGRNSGESTVAVWNLQENERRKTGVPDSVTTAVLLRRYDSEPFNARVELEADVDWVSGFARKFTGVPLDDTVLFNPALGGSKPRRGRSYGAKDLGRVDLYKLCAVRFAVEAPFAVK